MSHNRQKRRKGKESDYNIFFFRLALYGATKEQNKLPKNNAKTENY